MAKRGSKKGSPKGNGFVYQQRAGGNYYFQYMENGSRKTVSLKTKNLRTAEIKARELRGEVAELKTKEDYLTKIAANRRLMKASAIKLKDGWEHYLKAPGDDKPNSSSGTLENHKRHYIEFVDWLSTNYPTITELSDVITLPAGCGMFSPYISNLSPERLEQALNKSSKPSELAPGYTPSEFCKLAKISKQTLWNWEHSGKITLSRVGRVVRVPRFEAERILEQGETCIGRDQRDKATRRTRKLLLVRHARKKHNRAENGLK